ncbi:hypothetical protein [Halostagnicola kamekurae]|uniref:Uncharacterized protein n=1 Tax=Halostagnicola kamekurae TaxID=619731 RepID=A0A1I6REQ0_9EURY|nr:hypothetical protein [Halostagnicola kamekurae]SFS63060.1 hypothetical protein SAMN04488556_1736 [Halostagnicola kamekurae]
MTEVSKITVPAEIKQVWTWPSLGRALAVVAINGTEHLMEFDI